MSSSILIVGTGALACLFAARFSAVEIPVTMLGTWSEGIAALRSAGVTLVEANGNEDSYPVHVVTNPEDCQDVDLVLVLVKSWQTEQAGHQLQTCLHPKSLVLTLQNGLGNHQKLSQLLGGKRVFQSVTTGGGRLLSPARVQAGGEGLISIQSDPKLAPFVENFHRAHFVVDQIVNIEPLIWGKLAINAAINPLTAILNVPNGELLARAESRTLMALAAREVAAVAAAQEIQLPFDNVTAAVKNVARRTASNHSSMLQDMQRCAPTEIEAINGAVIQVANQTGVPVPLNLSLYLLVKSMIGQKTKKRVPSWNL